MAKKRPANSVNVLASMPLKGSSEERSYCSREVRRIANGYLVTEYDLEKGQSETFSKDHPDLAASKAAEQSNNSGTLRDAVKHLGDK